ncbi:UDP-N-acetylmuramoyl-L-alanyl-D-glutamate--2,6-diaminopimelate ligase [Mobiluncus mulieris]|uniref:UDP-N-acetylmuramoyl-L-alanyl-D-glutamate--2, 6-diaminopimelate ligase n=1 Tax=Mobiluncus mulieris TaxID=2052 RepID=UPI00147044CB|nr:UDP-N-acetylmuramoyl-L-alanyl-D-glutamate--2,6-diaminopimelate ligase [Mobiluncus mulieris]NMX00745.1 UDP-N-acetylmuramoyl-L-alanyl-D-glutamate--2,6-diaminopimelate ligase [Mobiluncus mulieris]
MTLENEFNPFEPDLQALAWVDTAAIADAVGGTRHGPAGQVRGAVIDNRDVRGGELFIAMPGLHVHGAKFTPDAISRGAKAVLTDAAGLDLVANPEVPVITVPDVPHAAGRAAAMAWGNPANHLRLWGVTGTNGKTTTTYLLRHLLHRVGKLAALVGTVEVAIGKRSVPSNITTPQAAQVQAIAASTVAAHLEDLVLEVSSHALGLGRVDPLRFRVAGFCNLTHDHLDFHHSMEDYFQTKASLFTERRSDRQVIIVDDDWGRRLAEQLERMGQHDFVTLSTTGFPADWQASITPDTSGYSHLDLRAFDGKTASVQVLMPGRFNAVNTALAIVMLVTGLSVSPRMLNGDILRHLCSHPIRVEVPGRMELIANQPRVIVDFAHNPGALKSLLETLRPSTAGRLRLVFGGTGQRDLEKRPILGRIAGELADFTYLTDDDPHEEDPDKIRAEVRAGLEDFPGKYVEIAGRSAAIKQAIQEAKPQDTVVIAGRGHETLQETPVGAIDLDDRVEARAALQLRN